MRLCAFIALIALTGCGPAEVPTVSLAGTVALDNVPLKAGVIVFYPDAPGAAQVSAIIKDGRFEAPVVPQGLYKAAIRSQALDLPSDKKVDSSFGAPTAKPMVDPIPLKYREPSVPVDASTSQADLKIELKSK